jgi:hypothetical protein
MKKLSVDVGDVLLLTDGRLARVESEMRVITRYFMLQFADMSGQTYQEDDGTLDVERNLGQSDLVLSNFYMVHGIHAAISKIRAVSYAP